MFGNLKRLQNICSNHQHRPSSPKKHIRLRMISRYKFLVSIGAAIGSFWRAVVPASHKSNSKQNSPARRVDCPRNEMRLALKTRMGKAEVSSFFKGSVFILKFLMFIKLLVVQVLITSRHCERTCRHCERSEAIS